MEEKIIYSRNVLDFITVSTELCKLLEQCGNVEREKFIDIMRGLLPMIYLKVSLIGDVPSSEGFNSPAVSEEDYDFVRTSVASIMADKDDYLDVFVEDFKFSDTPVLRTVSEGLADIYQALRNMLEIYKEGHEEAMAVALFDCLDQFKIYWGQELLNVLRAIHDVRFGENYETGV